MAYPYICTWLGINQLSPSFVLVWYQVLFSSFKIISLAEGHLNGCPRVRGVIPKGMDNAPHDSNKYNDVTNKMKHNKLCEYVMRYSVHLNTILQLLEPPIDQHNLQWRTLDTIMLMHYGNFPQWMGVHPTWSISWLVMPWLRMVLTCFVQVISVWAS